MYLLVRGVFTFEKNKRVFLYIKLNITSNSFLNFTYIYLLINHQTFTEMIQIRLHFENAQNWKNYYLQLGRYFRNI
jgi:hypothetical protein